MPKGSRFGSTFFLSVGQPDKQTLPNVLSPLLLSRQWTSLRYQTVTALLSLLLRDRSCNIACFIELSTIRCQFLHGYMFIHMFIWLIAKMSYKGQPQRSSQLLMSSLTELKHKWKCPQWSCTSHVRHFVALLYTPIALLFVIPRLKLQKFLVHIPNSSVARVQTCRQTEPILSWLLAQEVIMLYMYVQWIIKTNYCNIGSIRLKVIEKQTDQQP